MCVRNVFASSRKFQGSIIRAVFFIDYDFDLWQTWNAESCINADIDLRLEMMTLVSTLTYDLKYRLWQSYDFDFDWRLRHVTFMSTDNWHWIMTWISTNDFDVTQTWISDFEVYYIPDISVHFGIRCDKGCKYWLDLTFSWKIIISSSKCLQGNYSFVVEHLCTSLYESLFSIL